MDSVDLALEALKLSREWATWVAGMSVATIGGVFALLTTKEHVLPRVDVLVQHKHQVSLLDGRYLLLGGLLCLAVSIAWASTGLAGIPDVAIQIGNDPKGSIFSKVVPFPFPSPFSFSLPLWVPLYMQNMTFGLGMFLIVLYLWSAYVGTMQNRKDS